MKNQMRIAIFTDNFYPELSGVADSVLLEARGLAHLGHKVTIFAPRYGDEEFRKAGILPGEIKVHERIKIVRVPSWSVATATGQGRATFPGSGFRSAHGMDFDVVHSHSFMALGFDARMLARRRRIPLVATNHTALSHFLQYVPLILRGVLPRLQRWYYRNVDMLTAPSEAMLKELSGGASSRARVVANAIDEDFFVKEKTTHKGVVFLYVGRISQEKNVRGLIDLFARYHARGNHGSPLLRIIGGGSLKEELIAYVASLEMGDHITFEGPYLGPERPKLVAGYASSDCFITLSPSEVQPLTVLQAFAAGIPVIAADNPALAELVTIDRGILIDPNDENDGVVAMGGLIADEMLRSHLGKNAREWAKSLSVDVIAQKWQEIFHYVTRA